MTSVFSWQNSVSFCPASFCTSGLNFPIGAPGWFGSTCASSAPGRPWLSPIQMTPSARRLGAGPLPPPRPPTPWLPSGASSCHVTPPPGAPAPSPRPRRSGSRAPPVRGLLGAAILAAAEGGKSPRHLPFVIQPVGTAPSLDLSPCGADSSLTLLESGQTDGRTGRLSLQPLGPRAPAQPLAGSQPLQEQSPPTLLPALALASPRDEA